MKIDNLTTPDTLWYEDGSGNKIDCGIFDPTPECKYQVIKSLEVRSEIYSSFCEAKWPVRFLKWITSLFPNSWQQHNLSAYRSHTAISDSSYPVIKYLVENKKWRFEEACIVSSDLCERCMNICIWESEGQDLSCYQSYLDSAHTYCEHCKKIDPEYYYKHRIWCCYRTFKYGGNISKAFKNITVDAPQLIIKITSKKKKWWNSMYKKVFKLYMANYEKI